MDFAHGYVRDFQAESINEVSALNKQRSSPFRWRAESKSPPLTHHSQTNNFHPLHQVNRGAYANHQMKWKWYLF